MFKKSEIIAMVRQAITDQVGYTHDKITDSKNLEADLAFDALDLCELAMELEERFRIIIPEDEAAAQHTVGDWIRLVEAKLEAKGVVEKGGETR